MFSINDKVFLGKFDDYDSEAIGAWLLSVFQQVGLAPARVNGKKVTIKPNLVMKMAPEKGGTTHPAVVAAAAKLLISWGASVTIAESSGGLYTEANLRALYRACGMEDAAAESGAVLNYDTAAREVSCPDGVQTKMFHLIEPVLDCDFLLNIGKLKTHGLTGMTGCAKNLFGTIPGVEKFEMHARFTAEDDFETMLLDLCLLHHSEKEVIDLCDGIIGMEGNGPTGGEAKYLGALLCSRNPFLIDRLGAHLIGLDGRVPMLEKAIGRGYCPKNSADIAVEGVDPETMCTVFAESDAKKKSKLQFVLTLGGGRFKKPFEPRPYINRKKCIGCGECIRSCPEITISWYKGNSGAGRKAVIHPEKCIRCFCCQELCPHRAVEIKKNPLLKVAGKLR